MSKTNSTIETIGKVIKDSAKNFYSVTDTDGMDIFQKGKFFEDAKNASRREKIIIKNNIKWIPITINKVSIGAVGLKINKITKEEITLIRGLMDEFSYKKFLEEQASKYLDPKSDFIKELLTKNSIKNLDQAIDKADILGLNLRSQQAAIVVHVPGLFKKFHKKCQVCPKEKSDIIIKEECERLISALRASFENYDQNIFAYLELDTFVALKWARGQINTLNTINFYRKKAEYISKTIKAKTGITPTIGVGQYYPGLSGLRKSFADAKTSLDLGTKIWGSGNIYHITDVGMLMAFSPEVTMERKCELAHQIIGKLFDDPDLYKTVEAFLDNDMSLTEAAKKLHLHRNTLIYRLDKIKKETGLDPRRFSDAIQIKLGILLYGPRTENC